MLIYLIRHGETVYNTEKRYQGSADIPLSPAGRATLHRADFDPDIVWTSPLTRAVETAQIIFPSSRIIPIQGLREMDFGAFEGRNANEMEQDADYRAWVDGRCVGRCPGGESMEEFAARTCPAFAALVQDALAQKREQLVVVAHGGTQMAVLGLLSRPVRDYYRWMAPNGGGYILKTDAWEGERPLELVREVSFTSA